MSIPQGLGILLCYGSADLRNGVTTGLDAGRTSVGDRQRGRGGHHTLNLSGFQEGFQFHQGCFVLDAADADIGNLHIRKICTHKQGAG